MDEGQKSKTLVLLASCKMFEEMKAKMMIHDGLCFSSSSSSSWPPKHWGYVGCPLTQHAYLCTRGFPTLFSSTYGPKPDQHGNEARYLI
jgi:hypothetical protein